jgi:hypothetical protein
MRAPLRLHDHSRPYVIGLTGGSCSGKSTMGKRLSKLGALVVDCDALGHTAYMPGTQCFEKVADAFGRDVVINDKGEINRPALGRLVFGNPGTVLCREIFSFSDDFIFTLSVQATRQNWSRLCGPRYSRWQRRKWRRAFSGGGTR